MVLDPTLSAVIADAIHMDQILMNLVVNARDAMPLGGAITIATRQAVDDDYVAGAGVVAGPPGHVVLTVADTGVGMSREVMARIFEPFFTTKERGRGTGLGLAAVFGIVKQLKGAIRVASEIDKGTTFTILLPKTDQRPDSAEERNRAGVEVGSETVLLVEDESGVRRFVRTILERHGYRVLEADSSEAAIALLDRFDGRVDVLVTDVMLSGLDGAQLAIRLRQERPALPILFMSGYAEPAILNALPSAGDVLYKPFTAQTLLARVKKALATTAAAS